VTGEPASSLNCRTRCLHRRRGGRGGRDLRRGLGAVWTLAISPERNVVHEHATVDLGEIHNLLATLRKRIERTHDVVSIDAEIKREGTVPAHTGPVTLFIDPFGRPLSPVSVCGVRRRGRRRMRRRF
jgi:hypothetical protein